MRTALARHSLMAARPQSIRTTTPLRAFVRRSAGRGGLRLSRPPEPAIQIRQSGGHFSALLDAKPANARKPDGKLFGLHKSAPQARPSLIHINRFRYKRRSPAHHRRSETGPGASAPLQVGGEGTKHGDGDVARRPRGRIGETSAPRQGAETEDRRPSRSEHENARAQACQRGHDLRGGRGPATTKPRAPIHRREEHIAVPNCLAVGLRGLRLFQSRVQTLDGPFAVDCEERAAASLTVTACGSSRRIEFVRPEKAANWPRGANPWLQFVYERCFAPKRNGSATAPFASVRSKALKWPPLTRIILAFGSLMGQRSKPFLSTSSDRASMRSASAARGPFGLCRQRRYVPFASAPWNTARPAR